jgi:hypothetical protein
MTWLPATRGAEAQQGALYEPDDELRTLLPPVTVTTPRDHHRRAIAGDAANPRVVLGADANVVVQVAQLSPIRCAVGEQIDYRKRVETRTLGRANPTADGRAIQLSGRLTGVEPDGGDRAVAWAPLPREVVAVRSARRKRCGRSLVVGALHVLGVENSGTRLQYDNSLRRGSAGSGRLRQPQGRLLRNQEPTPELENANGRRSMPAPGRSLPARP